MSPLPASSTPWAQKDLPRVWCCAVVLYTTKLIVVDVLPALPVGLITTGYTSCDSYRSDLGRGQTRGQTLAVVYERSVSFGVMCSSRVVVR